MYSNPYALPPRHCERRKVRGNPLLFIKGKRILSCFALRMTSRFVTANAVRCTAIRLLSLHVIASAERCAAIRHSLKGITDSFVLRTQNDKFFVTANAVRCTAIHLPSLHVIASDVVSACGAGKSEQKEAPRSKVVRAPSE